MAPPKEVTAVFRTYLLEWQMALERWKKKCEPVQLERQKILARYLVADATPTHRQPARNAPVADVPTPGNSGLSPEMAKRLEETEDLAARCDKVIPELQSVIAKLQEAQFSGVWSGGPQLSAALLKEPKFAAGKTVGHVSREEKVTVLEVKGEWWRVRTLSGQEGWVHRAQLKPRLPTELSSKPGLSTGDTNREEIELGDRG